MTAEIPARNKTMAITHLLTSVAPHQAELGSIPRTVLLLAILASKIFMLFLSLLNNI
jgi:hypothetical protein